MIIALVLAAASFILSASAGLGGSLILVPTMSLILGPKQGITLAALLLGCNNIAKVFAYRHVIPLRETLVVILLTILGTAIGAQLLVAAPISWVNTAIIASIGWTFVSERIEFDGMRRVSAPFLAFCAGATSGFSGSSGPLKGIALRNLGFDRLHLVGAASVVSLTADAIKATIFLHASLMDETSWRIALFALPLMPLATYTGRHINARIGERAYSGLFWIVMTGYSVRLVLFALP